MLFGNRSRGGFSLIELLVVIAIIGVLAAVAFPRYGEFRASAYDARTQQDLRNLATAQELHRAGNPSYAIQLNDLAAFTTSEGVDISIDSADESRFTASASHPAGRHRYAWDSSGKPPMSSTKRR